MNPIKYIVAKAATIWKFLVAVELNPSFKNYLQNISTLK